jgi:integrase
MQERTPAKGITREKVKPGIWRRRNAKGKPVYEITFRDSDGRQRRQTVAGGMREAEQALADVKARMGKGERIAPNPKLTFAAAQEAWLEAKGPNLQPKTLKTYDYALKTHLLPRFGRRKLTEIDVTSVARFVAAMKTAEYRREVQERTGQKPTAETGYAVETIKSVLIPLSRTIDYAKRHMGHGGENPVRALDRDERPGYREHKRKKPKLGREQLDRLVEAAESPWREIIATAAALGTRMGETLGIQWRDVDFERSTITIERQANAKRELARVKSESGYRRIEAPSWLMATLAEVKLRSTFDGPDDLVFCTRTGKPHGHGNVLARGLYPALTRAGLPQTSFHSLRHTHASLWIKDGGDVITLSKRLGHANPQVTMTTYASEIEEANDSALRLARVEAMYEGTGMAALMAAGGSQKTQQTATTDSAEVVSLADVRTAAQ